MSEISQVWDGILLGDAAAVAPYSASEWAARQKLLQGQGTVFPNYGVLTGTGGGTYPALSVLAKSPATTQIEIEIGAALVAGYLYQNTTALSFTVGANASGNARVDTVILRVDFVGQTVRAVVKQGTPAGSPVAPSMQQDATYWEIPLADIAVANGFATLAQSTITQRQRFLRTNAAGWQNLALPVGYTVGLAALGTIVSEPVSTNGGTVLVPFTLIGNMLLQQVDMWVVSTGIAYNIGWDLYIEDTNDGLVAEHTLRRVAQSSDVSGTLPGAAAILSVQTLGSIVPLAPGAYWLAIQNRTSGGSAINLAVVVGAVGASFDNTNMYTFIKNAIVANNGQTLDVVTGWTALSAALMARLRGRVFGMTTVP